LWVLGSGRTIINSIVAKDVLKFLSNKFSFFVMNAARCGSIMAEPVVVKLGSNMSTKHIGYSNKFNKNIGMGSVQLSA
jgi:hypothetical protein